MLAAAEHVGYVHVLCNLLGAGTYPAQPRISLAYVRKMMRQCANHELIMDMLFTSTRPNTALAHVNTVRSRSPALWVPVPYNVVST
jgi:hypothetical protein